MIDRNSSSRRPRISLATFMLLVGLGTSVFLIWYLSIKRDRLQDAVYDLRICSKKLRVDDPTKIAVIAREKTFFGEQIFDLHVPPAPRFEMCIKVESIANNSDFSNPIARQPIPAGRVAIEVVDERHSPNVIVLIDGVKAIDVKKNKYASRTGSTSTSVSYQSCTSFEIDETICLFNRKLMFGVTIPNGKSKPLTKAQRDDLNAKQLGVLIWIQAVK